MKVLVLCNDRNVPLWGPGESSFRLRTAARSLAATGAQVFVASRCFEHPEGPSLRRPFECLEIPGRIEAGPGGSSSREMNDRLVAWLLVLHRRFPFDVIYERHSLGTTAGLEAGRRLSVRHVLETDPVLVRAAVDGGNPWTMGETHLAERFLIRKADRLLARSAGAARDLKRMGAPGEAILLEGVGVDTSFFDIHKDEQAPAETFTVGFTGALKPRHGIETLLAAWERLVEASPGWALRVVGDGPLGDRVERAFRELPGITWIRSPGDEELWRETARVDAGTAPIVDESDAPAPLPGLPEYMAAGIPVVASGGAVVREFVTHGSTGLIVPARDPVALATALEALRSDPGLAKDLGRAAKHEMKNHEAVRVSRRLVAQLPTLDSGGAAADLLFGGHTSGDAAGTAGFSPGVRRAREGSDQAAFRDTPGVRSFARPRLQASTAKTTC